MTWTRDDPGQGSPAAIQGLAQLRTARAGKIRDAQRALQSVSSGSGTEWQAMSQTAFAAKLSADASDIELLATGLEAQASALQTYAGQLSQIKDRQVVLEARRSSAQMDLAAAKSELPLPDLIPSSAASFPGTARRHVAPDSDVDRQHAVAQGHIDDAAARRRAVEADWDVLVSDRRRIDTMCAAALQSRDVLGAVSAISSSTIAASTPSELLDRLSGLTAADLAILLAVHPELASAMNEAPAGAVAAWWNSMDAGQQHAFVAGIPSVIGSLNGVPALDRVAANRRNAAERLDALEKTLSEWRSQAAQPGYFSVRPSEIAELETEIRYLHGAVDEPPTVQLYLYDKDDDRIVEMVGTPSASTRKVVTYTPGTLANMEQFYDGDTQRIARWLQQQDRDGVVGFVYKDGRYPQNPLTEANDETYAQRTGRQLAVFEDGLFRDPLLADEQSIAIGHSWGTSNITSSEMAGARYDIVVSLSGAGAPDGWRKRPETSYADFSYYDILQTAQDVRIGDHGAVWGGRNPRDIGFVHGDYYDAPVTWKNFPGNGMVSWSLPLAAGLDAHNLASSTNSTNVKLLDDMRDYIYDATER